jgi:hypothetical protein
VRFTKQRDAMSRWALRRAWSGDPAVQAHTRSIALDLQSALRRHNGLNQETT